MRIDNDDFVEQESFRFKTLLAANNPEHMRAILSDDTNSEDEFYDIADFDPENPEGYDDDQVGFMLEQMGMLGFQIEDI